MAVNDVYEVIDVQELYGQQVLNVYFYRQTALVDAAYSSQSEGLAYNFSFLVVPAVCAVQAGDITHTEIRVRNLFDDTDAFNLPISEPGTIQPASSNGASSFSAVGITLASNNAAVKDGAKRIGGLPDGFATDGVLSVSGILTALNSLMTALEDAVDGAGGVADPSFLPVIVKRIRSGVAGAYEYRLPENIGELVYGLVADALYSLLVTTQISRKVGVGE